MTFTLKIPSKNAIKTSIQHAVKKVQDLPTESQKVKIIRQQPWQTLSGKASSYGRPQERFFRINAKISRRKKW